MSSNPRASSIQLIHALEWWVARRYVAADHRASGFSLTAWIGVLSIALGVAVLLVVLGVMNGFEDELKSRLLAITPHATLSPEADNPVDWGALQQTVARAPHVKSVLPYVDSKGLLAHHANVATVWVRGIDVPGEIQRAHLTRHVVAGKLSQLSEQRFQVILGDSLAKQLGVALNGKVMLAVAEGSITPVGLMPRVRQLTVVGLVHTGLYELDSHLLVLNVADAKRIFHIANASGLDIELDDPLNAQRLVHQLAVDLGGGFYVSDWSRSHENIFLSIQTTKGILRVLLMLVLAVAAFNMVANLMLMVREKHRDVAIFRTLGLEPGSIARVFVWQGMMIALIGTALGVLLGLVVGHELTRWVSFIEHEFHWMIIDPKVYSIDELPVLITLSDIMWSVLTALLLGLSATLIPARTAARLIPAEILRHD